MADPEFLTVEHFSIRDIRRIFSRVQVTNTGCWDWTGYRFTVGGYGRVLFRKRLELTHRLIYAWLVGPIPRGIGRHIPQLDHIVCSNPSCCNPAHLKLVSARANSARTNRNPIRDNAAKVICVRGHILPSSPNDKHQTKRYCVQCSRNQSRARRDDPDYVEYMKSYLRDYHKERKRGPLAATLRKKGAEATRRYRARKLSPSLFD